MIHINLQDGTTVTLDPCDESEAAAWVDTFAKTAFQGQIRGATFQGRGVAHVPHTNAPASYCVRNSVPRPNGFDGVLYKTEVVLRRGGVVGERVIVYADNVRLALTSHHATASCRVELSKMS